MAKSKIKFPKISKIVSQDDLRPSQNYSIVTDDGLLIATDGYILLVYDLAFNFSSWKNAIGKAFHRDLLSKMEKAIHIQFEKTSLTITNTKKRKEHYRYSAEQDELGMYYQLDLDNNHILDGDSFNFPNWKNIIWSDELRDNVVVPDIGINMKLLTKLSNVLGENLRFKIPANKRLGIKVENLYREEKDRTFALVSLLD